MIPGNHDECVHTDKITHAPGLDKFGTYNTLPEPIRRISADTFTKYITRERIIGVESRQPGDLRYSTLRIFWLAPGNGVGISRQYRYGIWVDAYWFLGCEHRLVERELTQECRDLVGDHAHEYICELCGYGLVTDSSG